VGLLCPTAISLNISTGATGSAGIMSSSEMLKGEKVLSHCQSPSEILWIFERLSLLQGQHLCLFQSFSDQGCRSGMSSKIHCFIP
jgi:hypothetical protein